MKEEEQEEEEGGAAAGIERQEVERLLAQEVLKSRLLLSPFEEFALTLDFKLSKVARAAIPLLLPLLLPSVSSLSNHPNRVAKKKPLHTLRRVTRVLGRCARRSCYSVINMNYV